MPTLPRMKYFHAASIAAGVRYMPTMTTVIRVASSRPTQSNPILFAVSARFMAPIIAMNIAW